MLSKKSTNAFKFFSKTSLEKQRSIGTVAFYEVAGKNTFNTFRKTYIVYS